jgi:hypothetical protein
MKQTQKLNALISKIIKEELDKSQKGTLDVTIPSKFAFALADPRVSDDPSYVSFMKSKDDGKTYNLKIQSKTPEFKELKRAMGRIDNSISIDTPELEKIYNDIMSGIEKADIEGSVDLIKQGRKSGLEEEEKEYVTQDGTAKTATSQQKNDISKTKAGSTLKYRKAGSGTTSTTQGALEENEEEMQEPDMEQKPKASEIAGQLAEIMEKLKSMAEGEDPKKGKHAAKVMKYMESAKAALEALTAHETMLEEKDQAEQEKKAEKHKKNIEKIFKGIVKDENIVNRLKDKLSPKDIAALSKKLGEKGKELDEEKLARIVLNRSLKEGWAVKKK